MSKIGLLDYESLDQTFADAGVEVITGDDLVSAVTAISHAFASGAFPLVVTDTDDATASAWLTAVVGQGQTVAVLRDGESLLDLPGAREVTLPATVNEVLEGLEAAEAYRRRDARESVKVLLRP